MATVATHLFLTPQEPDVLYMKSDNGTILIVLEPANLEEIQKGRPAVTPDKTVMIAFTPDPVWLADKILDVKDGDAAEIARLIEVSQLRTPSFPPRQRKYHPVHEHQFGKGPGEAPPG